MGNKFKILYIAALSLALVLIPAMLPIGSSAATFAREKKTSVQKSDTTAKKKLSAYEKLFDNKKVKTATGLFTVHNVEGKLYFEFPVKLLGKSFLMSPVVDNVSNMSVSYVGQRTARPSHINFTQSDSLIKINTVPVPKLVESADEGIQRAVAGSSLPTVIASAPVLAYNADSTAVVFDATSFFVSGGKHIGSLNASSFGGFIQKVSTFSKELSSLKDVEAYDDNVTVISNMTYTFKTFFLGMESEGFEYLTAELKTTLNLLPEEPFRWRTADYRIGTAVTEFEKFDSREQGVQRNYFANRWRIEPAKPIVFYIDTLFSPSWRDAVKRGLLKWNEAFEKIGFKNVIQVHDYPSPSSDPKFSSSNIAYNCVKYVQLPSRNISRQINVDPRTGEILSANILFFKDSPVTLQRERIYQTAAVEPGVRSYELPDDLMCSAIELAMTREMGFCLGLSANLAASSWMPADSLRSPSFTSKNGITSSVMDQIKYNYLAQPGDIEKGVKLTADKLGVYDYHAIEWLYKPLTEATTPKDEERILRKMITDRSSDPRYYYGREQNWSAYFDPRAMAEDLGNDKIKAARYGISTLRYVAENAEKWVNKDQVDESYRELFVDFIFLKLYDYYRSLMVNIGGIEINNKYEGDPNPAYRPIDRELQRASLLYMLEQADDLKWMDNKDLIMMSGMNATLSTHTANNLISLVFQRVPMLAFAQTKTAGWNDGTDSKGGKNEPYTIDDMLGDIIDFALKNISKGEDPSEAQTSALYSVTQLMLQNSALPKVTEARAKSKAAFQLADQDDYYSYQNVMLRCNPDLIAEADQSAGSFDSVPGQKLFASDESSLISGESSYKPGEISGFETLVGIKYLTNEDFSSTFYKHLTDLRKRLGSYKSKVRSENTRSRIEYLILSIDKGVGK